MHLHALVSDARVPPRRPKEVVYLIRVNHLLLIRKATTSLKVHSVMGMSAPDSEGRVTRGLDGLGLWRRMAAFMYRALCICSCLSAVGPFVSLRLDGESANAPSDSTPSLRRSSTASGARSESGV